MRVVDIDGRSRWVDPREMDLRQAFWGGVGMGFMLGLFLGTAFGLWLTTEGTETRLRGARKDDCESHPLRATHQQLAHPIHEITPSRCALVTTPPNDQGPAPLIHRQRTLQRQQFKICCRRVSILGGWYVRSGEMVMGAQTLGVEFKVDELWEDCGRKARSGSLSQTAFRAARMGVSVSSVVMIAGGVAWT